MNKLTIYPIAVAIFFSTCLNQATAQFNVRMNVLSGAATTTCTDVIGATDPQWAININGAGWVTYPAVGGCYTNFPNEQFNQTYPCLSNIPTTIPVCFRAFENDATILNPCTPVFSCQAELCINVPVPPMGTVPFNITLPAGGPSGGSVSMNIAVSGLPFGVNDAICNAIPLGILQTGLPVGFPDTSIFNNTCATNLNEPDPAGVGGWFNNQGVWFSFTTSANPSGVILVEANSDPSNFGDPVNLQVAIFESSNNSCTGTFTFITEDHDPANFEESLLFSCPKPNTTYFILVDGVFSNANNVEVEGWFGLQATELDVQPGSELRCTAENIGTVPLGGSISSALRTNACSMNTNASPATAFGVQKSVWFSFTTPPTGHVFLQGTSSGIDPIDLQIAVYRSATNGCTGMVEVASQHTNTENDELMELNCLDPNTTYFIMVDGGAGALNTGIFTLTLTDAGNETPTTTLNPTVCFGESFAAGGNNYAQTGNYADTLQLLGGCDSIVVTNLTVLPQLQPNLQIVNQGVGLGNTAGQAQASPSGGAGGYGFLWSNGQTSSLATGLVGGDNYCVTVSDANGCEADTCFAMPFFVNFIPTAMGSSLDCHGDTDGSIEFSAIGGQPPYLFDWVNLSNNTVSGSGQISFDGQVISQTGLPGGQYSIHLSDVTFDTTVFVQILEPTQLVATVVNQTNATCFMGCDGAISINAAGGTASIGSSPYQIVWSNGSTGPSAMGLCAGQIGVTVTDANGCTAILDEEITEPPLFTVTATEEQTVSCFQGSDGEAMATPSENAQSFLWDNGETTAAITGLPGGTYFVTATNAAGCSASSSVTIGTPAAPVAVTIAEVQGIICQGDETGELLATPTGPGNVFNFSWSNGSTQPTAANLPAGPYSVTVSNENGCTATASATLTEPTEIVATASTNALTCLDPADGGIITVEQVTGGNPPYLYSSDGFSFGPSPELTGYFVGNASFFVEDAGGCVREFQANIEGPAEFLVDLGSDKTIDLGDSITLQVTASQPGLLAYAWSPAEGLSCVDCASPVASPTSSGAYGVVATTPDGCIATDEIYITVHTNTKVYIPNVFSPNGDGINDEFLPYTGSAVQNIKSFRVFDRYGNAVFQLNNMPQNQPGFGWNGEFRGKRMQPAVFVWLAEIEFVDGKVLVYKGDVTLVR